MIESYKSKPSFFPKGKSFYGLYFGVELEVEVRQSIERHEKAQEITGLFKNNFVITKKDSSIMYGFEICSSPASLDYHSKAWNSFFELGIIGLKGFGTDTCGMHVHISRAPLTNLQIGKMVVFLHNPDNYKFIQRIAQRDSNKFCRFDNERVITDAKPEKCIKFNRHTAINLLNPATIEIRIFKSNLKRENFLKNIEFCHALSLFTWPGNVSILQSRSWKNFVMFVQSNKDMYPNLFNFLLEYKYISKTKRHLFLQYEQVIPKINFSEMLKRKTQNSFLETSTLTAF